MLYEGEFIDMDVFFYDIGFNNLVRFLGDGVNMLGWFLEVWKK